MSDDNYILGTLSSGESVPLLLADRRRHLYLCGKTGTGKTGLFLNLMHADLLDGAGFCFLDPHGDASLATSPPRASDYSTSSTSTRPIRPTPSRTIP